MRNLMVDTIAVVSQDGSRHEKVRASVQRKQIFINDTTIPIVIGDRIVRMLPSGQKEVFIVTDVHLWKGLRPNSSHYEISYKREGTQAHRPQRDRFICASRIVLRLA